MSELVEQRSFPADTSRRVPIKEVELTPINQTVTEIFCEYSNARYLSPCPTEAAYSKYYEQPKLFFHKRSFPTRLHHLTELLNHTNIALDGKKILDVGCGFGDLAKVLINTFGCTVFGVEPSPIAREIASRAGIQILGRRMGDIPAQVFDAVVCFHVLDKVPTPDSFVSEIFDLIKTDGYLFLEVPDGFWVGDTHFFHPWSFSRRSLILLLNRAGLRVLRIDCRDTLGYPNRIDTITLVAQKESNPIEDQDGAPPALTYKQYRVIRYGTLYQRTRRILVQFLPEPVKFPLRIILRKLRGT